MALYDEQKVLYETGSFTGFRPHRELGANYLSASPFKQPLCGNEEGWGPLSPYRYDFTPCFIDVWIAAVSVFGLVFGSLAIWWLLVRKQKQESQSKNTYFFIKQVINRRDKLRLRHGSIELTVLATTSPSSPSSSSTSLLSSLFRSCLCQPFGLVTSES